MKKILLVFTGGTIGSSTVNGKINTSKHQRYKLLDCFKQSYSNHKAVSFKTIQPLQILSENLFPSTWETLIKAIEKENPDQYDGIIVTHGTDTLAFTSAALSFYFNALKIPLLLVSSDHPLEHPQANGLTNFICAIEFIMQIQKAGVFVPYKNPDAKTLVHIGSRLAASLQLSGDFISVQSKAYLQFENNHFQVLNEINPATLSSRHLKPLFSPRLLLIKPYPGLDYSHFVLDNIDVVIHDLYHSGTACSSLECGKNHSLLELIKRCTKLDIPVYMTPSIKMPDAYISTHSLIEQGAKMVWNMSLESTYVKLLLAYGNFSDSSVINEFLLQNIALEIID